MRVVCMCVCIHVETLLGAFRLVFLFLCFSLYFFLEVWGLGVRYLCVALAGLEAFM